jgi:Phosphotransferase enzyme family
VVQIPTDIEPEWLTEVLRGSGALTCGRVEAVDQAPTSAFNSSTAHLRLRLSQDAPGDAPTALILKRNTPAEWSVLAGQAEVAFYQLIARTPDHPAIIVPCLSSGIDEGSGDSFVLLKDLSSSHEVVVPRDVQLAMVDGVPADAQITAVVDTLARLHAYWWERVTEPIEVNDWWQDLKGFNASLELLTKAWHSVVRDHGAWLPAEVIELYERILSRLSGFWEREIRDRMRERRNLSLVHGDAYFANFLCPIPPGTGTTYLIDWQSPCFDIPANDLVNLCATFWTAQQRNDQLRERRILRRYHDMLCVGGVTGYSLDDLHADYTRTLIDWVFVPVMDAADGSARDYWWPKMRCLIAAYHDWNCEAMLSPHG